MVNEKFGVRLTEIVSQSERVERLLDGLGRALERLARDRGHRIFGQGNAARL